MSNFTVSIIIPCYNESTSIEKVVDAVNALEINKEIICVDDGSTDGSAEMLERLSRRYPVVFLRHQTNKGKGAALRTGLSHARGKTVIIQDADLEYDCREIPRLIAPILDGQAEVVFGSRFLKENPNLYRRYLWGNKFLTGFLNLLCRVHLTDSYTCYKAFGQTVIQALSIESHGFEVEAEISVKVALGGYRFRELAINYRPRSLQEGKKIGWKDAFLGLLTVVKTWWKYRAF